MHRLTSFARGAAGVDAIVAYQVGAHYVATTPGAHGVGLATALLPPLAIAPVTVTRTTHRVWLLPLWLLVYSMLWMVRAPLAVYFDWGLYLEHASLSLMMVYVFGRTLVTERESLCTCFAHMVHGTFTPYIACYSRQVTLARTPFSLATAAVSTLLFAMTSTVTRSTFANYLSLPLAGVVLATEYLCRRIVLRDEPHSSLFDAVRAY